MNNAESGILSRTVNQTEAIEEEKVVAHCAGHRSWRDELHLQNKCFDKDININVWSRSEHAAVVIYIFRVV